MEIISNNMFELETLNGSSEYDSNTQSYKCITAQQCWSYSTAIPFKKYIKHKFFRAPHWIVLVRVKLSQGRIGLFVTNKKNISLCQGEIFVDNMAKEVCLSFMVDYPDRQNLLVIRNATLDNTPAIYEVIDFTVKREQDFKRPYLVNLQQRNYHSEQVPENGDLALFEDEQARTINVARLKHLENLNLDLANKSVVDLGCGVGHLANFYSNKGCQVTAVDARKANIDHMNTLYPHLRGEVWDVQKALPEKHPIYQIVHCYGLLYHLDTPAALLRNCYALCDEMVLIETMITDSSQPIFRLVDEHKGYNQSISGLGCRPSPSFIAMALNRIGFSYIYGCHELPDHQDFQFVWKDNGDFERDNHPLRIILIASKVKLINANLFELI